MKYVIGIDIGTSSTKSVIFDTEGNIVAEASREYPLYQIQNGWAEQNPEDWWRGAKETLKEITKDVNTDDISGIGLTGQMHGLVMLDENCEVIRDAIIWCDGRTSRQCKEIEELIGRDKLIEITANPALEGFTASKIMWVKENEPENYEKCRHILLPKDYIRFKLTGEFATDVSDASGMQLLDVKNRCWSEEVCKKLGIDMSYLAKVYESPRITGYITAEAAELTGLKKGVAVASGAGDNAAAAIGVGVCKKGKAFTTIGTSGVVFAHTDLPVIDKRGRVHTFCCAVPGAWHVMGVTQAAGLSLNWFKNNIAESMSYKEIDEVCREIAIGSERLIYLPYLMGERSPVLDSNARGVFFGLSAMHKKAHMARAVMEGVSYSLKSCIDVLEEMGIEVSDMAVCGGGGKSGFWRQMLSDVYNIGIKTFESDEGPALGAAILGGCAGGVFGSVEDGCCRMVKEKARIEPDGENHKEYMKFYKIYERLYYDLKEAFGELREV